MESTRAIAGNITGNIAGNIAGNITGNIGGTGNIGDDITGNITARQGSRIGYEADHALPHLRDKNLEARGGWQTPLVL